MNTFFYNQEKKNVTFQMRFSSREVVKEILLKTQPSYMCPPQESPAHFPSCLKIEADTVWRTPGSCAADTPVTPVCSGAETLAHGRRCSTLTQGDINMSPGPLAMASAPTSWEGGKVKWREPDSTQEPGFPLHYKK